MSKKSKKKSNKNYRKSQKHKSNKNNVKNNSNKEKADNKKKNEAQYIRCRNCKSEDIKNNQPRLTRLKFNALSVVLVILIVGVWFRFSDTMEATPSTYALMGLVMVAISGFKIYKKQYKCKNCGFSWD